MNDRFYPLFFYFSPQDYTSTGRLKHEALPHQPTGIIGLLMGLSTKVSNSYYFTQIIILEY